MQNFRQFAVRDNLQARAGILSAVRLFFETNGYLEVETPVRLPTQAPEAHIDAEVSDGWLLQTSPEVCMKRLLAAGYRKIFQICKCFRKKERGAKHLPEITLLEWYRAGVDYMALMDETEKLVRFVAEKTGIGRSFSYKGNEIDLSSPWEKLSVHEAFSRFAGIGPEQAISENRFDEVLAFQIEPNLGLDKPLFLFDYPVEVGALARRKKSDPEIAERFELYISGLELCNAFSELVDPSEQRRRFEIELAAREKTGKTVYPMPEKFLKSLEEMPESSGCALGLDRLTMLLTNANRIDDVVAFTPEEL